jgi:hypothetical protein
VHAIAADGSVGRLINAVLSGTVNVGEPSRLDAGLPDVPSPAIRGNRCQTTILAILKLRYAGQPAEKNLWAGYDRDLRHHWAGVAPGRRSAAPSLRPNATNDSNQTM